MDIAMTTTTVTPTVATPRPRTESRYPLGTGIAQPLSWHDDVARTALPDAGNAGAAGFVADTRTAKQPHPPRGIPR